MAQSLQIVGGGREGRSKEALRPLLMTRMWGDGMRRRKELGEDGPLHIHTRPSSELDGEAALKKGKGESSRTSQSRAVGTARGGESLIRRTAVPQCPTSLSHIPTSPFLSFFLLLPGALAGHE